MLGGWNHNLELGRFYGGAFKYEGGLSDGSVSNYSKKAGAAYVICKEEPLKIIGAGCASWSWASPIRMEAEAIAMGVFKARQLGLQNIFVCSDAETFIRTIQSGGPGPLQLQDCITRIRRNDSLEDPIKWCKVSRDAVVAPEKLARAAAEEQVNIQTIGVQDTYVRRLIQPVFPSLKQCVREAIVDRLPSIHIM
ncbi:hypothetical protein QJS10_CPB18g00882 [Acorus calamus]|uniref:RNase H type-1 domain-containing protein n=1 Tax=Acorus calamus TaxID=4465 RepID=A0AAV9CLK2_ACOCL|nr:hypothetical protein QJS10_CPB18g00882 [Acorus calamus]